MKLPSLGRKNNSNHIDGSGQGRNVVSEPRRTEHGGMAWASASRMHQPQDGAHETVLKSQPIPRVRGSFFRINEPEDAQLTGATRSLGRRLLGLNFVEATVASVVRKPVQAKGEQILPRLTQIA